ncbi:Hypothetical predicted protein [Mytilus galloprovincialis]|uniref:Uncharacterized protein n=1 Tax=Mytilus galloprovincialis TaxID=29158 RepID=A0A8B6E0H9_MYTGA|nr:Hypothetical predicted protein [Mytilus galloprovincialis]
MDKHNTLTVDFVESENMRPRAYSESSAKKPENPLKKFQLPTIFIEEVDDFDEIEPMPRQRAYTSPDEMFRRRKPSRPGTPPPLDSPNTKMKKQSSLERIGARPHKLSQVPEN